MDDLNNDLGYDIEESENDYGPGFYYRNFRDGNEGVYQPGKTILRNSGKLHSSEAQNNNRKQRSE